MDEQNKSGLQEKPCCYDPVELFSTAAAISILLYKQLSACQIDTVINLLTLITANLSAFATQQDINKGEDPVPPY